MNNERDPRNASAAALAAAKGRAYHHGDLRNGLLEAARAIMEEESLAALTLRAVARKAGVSHAAPYRHFPNHEALLVELSIEGFDELRESLAEAAKAHGSESDKIANIGAAYMRFVAQRPALARLMFGGQLPNRDQFPALGLKADSIGQEIGNALHDSALGLENVIDLGQRRSGLHVLPTRAEIILRSLFSTARD
jgi:AcrR family transcriptional regulator